MTEWDGMFLVRYDSVCGILNRPSIFCEYEMTFAGQVNSGVLGSKL